MKNRDDYVKFLCELIKLKKDDIKLTIDNIKAFDVTFSEDTADREYFFEYIMSELIEEFKLNTFEEQVTFLEKNFDNYLISFLSEYYTEYIEGTQYINSFDDLKTLDKICGNEHSDIYNYYKQKDIYLDILDQLEIYTGSNDGNEKFARTLKIIDKLEPEKNHIPNLIIMLYEENDNDDVPQFMMPFYPYFEHEEFTKDDILKNYFTKHNMNNCLEEIEELNNPSPMEL